MGKSGKLFKNLVAGVRVFKSPSKERPVKDDKEYAKKKSKDKCFGSLGKSSSRSREGVAAMSASPEAIEIKCVQVESEKLKDVLPVPVGDSCGANPCAENKVPAKSQEGIINNNGFMEMSPVGAKENTMVLEHEELAASKIQAAFRCYLAQRAFRALRALVRLQALARGRMVRKQASASLRCLNALIRIQAIARGRRVRNSELGQLVQKHIQQTRQPRKKPADGWVSSTATAQQLHAKAQVKQDAVTKRQRALVYAFSEQLNRRTQKQSSSSGLDSQVDKSHWVWIWLERWTTATSKGGPAAISTEDCGPVSRNIEKAKINTKGGKSLDSSRKERRKCGEHAEGIPTLSQRDHISEEQEEPVGGVKEEEEMKVLPEPERLGTPKAHVSGGNSTLIITAQKPISSPPALSTPPSSPLKEGNTLPAREMGPHEEQSSTNEMPDVTECTSLDCEGEAKVATESIAFESHDFPSMTCGSNHASGAVVISSPGASQASSPSHNFSASNGHPVCAGTELSDMGSYAQSEEPKSDCLSVFSFSPPQGVCSPSESFSSAHPSKERNALGFSMSHTSSWIAESAHDGFSSGMCQAEEISQLGNGDVGMHKSEGAIHGINGENGQQQHIGEEIGYGIKGDVARMPSEPEGVAVESLDLKNCDYLEGDASSEANGGCNTSVVSADARATEVSSKNTTGPGLKHEQTESASPSLPSYMATTKSSKAKIRTLASPKQKSDSPKHKHESPKPKLDSPKTKSESPTTQKVDSASKRRHSLSALDGKVVSPAPAGTQRPTFHIRAGSKGNFSSMKDLSSDNLSLSNGDSRRHGK